MENLELSDVMISLSSGHSMQSSGTYNGTENFGNDATFVEKFLLDDLDSYLEDINDRLTISRMVSDSVIKGMVSAVSEEAAEKVVSKEAEVAFLNERLHFYECNTHRDKEVGLGTAADPKRTKLESIEQHLGNLKIAAEEQLQRLKKQIEDVEDCNSISRTNLGSVQQGRMLEKGMEMNKSLDALQSILEAVYEQINNLVMSEALLYEKQWKSEFQEEVDGIVFHSLIRCLRQDFEEKSREQSRLFSSQHKNLTIKIDELSSLRQELDAISRYLFCPEPGKLSSHGSHEFIEEWSNIERKDRVHRKVLGNHLSQSSSTQEENGTIASEKSKEPKSTISDTTESGLQHMPKDQLISYFKDEMTKMKRNHELIVQEKTEEYYRLKREYLREKDSSNWRKDKEFDAFRKKVPEVIRKLDDILVENEKSSMVCDDYDNIFSLKVRADNLHLENQHLNAMLMDKRKEVKCLSSQVSDAAGKMSHLSLLEANCLKQIEKLKCDIEDVNVELFIREDVYKSIIRELIGKIKWDMEDADIETIFTNEICMIVFRESVRDAEAAIDHIIMRYSEEKEWGIYLEAMLSENEKTLHLEIEENEKLKQDKALMLVLVEEKEKSTLEVSSTLIKQKECFKLVCKELNKLKDQAIQQKKLLYGSKKESDSIRSRLEEALGQIDLYKVEKSKLDQKLKEAMDNMKEAERQKGALHGIIQEKQNMIYTTAANELEQKRLMKSVIISVQKLSKEVVGFETRVTKNIVLNNSRLEMLNHQCSPFVQQVNLLKEKGLVYKRRLELRCSDLQNAEVEVDLLGDQVDVLQSLLGKIYIGLDHYSPILQHYPGIMETMELIRRAIEGETSKPV